ncbi:DUF1325 domain-containing protein [Rhizoctonia solani AG-1 IA]|uniref:DUF1325 domain-containing protein n=1 Tax=Thanatephorus cucumeris (strain AG1-IA) TaxID=983506 RepID=L8X266_THACA|nr:DUF1325 domain-containing protein [Rhizoctonia solani AG-1 IA]
MERRRAGTNRAPAGDSQLEQYQVWTRTQAQLQKFMTARAEDNTVEKVTKINRYISKFPPNEDMIKSAEMLDQYKTLKAKLSEGLESTRAAAEKEAKILDEALELLSVLIALRRPADSGPSGMLDYTTQPPGARLTLHTGENSKRTKRIRLSSPALNAHSPSPAPSSHPSASSHPRITVRLPTRSTEREKNGIPLREGRRVAFRPPKTEQWILGLVKRQFMESGKFKMPILRSQGRELLYLWTWCTTNSHLSPFMTDIRSLIPLPDPDAPVGSAAHISSYPEFSKGTEVMAIYESTTSFYRAVVVAGPKDPWQGGRVCRPRIRPQYKLQFEDDEGRVQSIPAFDVVEWPGSGRSGSGSHN